MPLVTSASVKKGSDVQQGFGFRNTTSTNLAESEVEPNTMVPKVRCRLCNVLKNIWMDLPWLNRIGINLAESKHWVCFKEEGNIAVQPWAFGEFPIGLLSSICNYTHTLGGMGMAFWVSAITYTYPVGEILYNITIYRSMMFSVYVIITSVLFWYLVYLCVFLCRASFNLLFGSFIPQCHGWNWMSLSCLSGKSGEKKIKIK